MGRHWDLVRLERLEVSMALGINQMLQSMSYFIAGPVQKHRHGKKQVCEYQVALGPLRLLQNILFFLVDRMSGAVGDSMTRWRICTLRGRTTVGCLMMFERNPCQSSLS